MDLGWIETGLAAQITPEGLAQHLQLLLADVVKCAEECVQTAGLRKTQVTALYLTGGSSALQTLRDALAQAFPGVPQVAGDLFGGVASGLAYA
ncbi:putative chaperone [compost metagenome]